MYVVSYLEIPNLDTFLKPRTAWLPNVYSLLFIILSCKGIYNVTKSLGNLGRCLNVAFLHTYLLPRYVPVLFFFFFLKSSERLPGSNLEPWPRTFLNIA